MMTMTTAHPTTPDPRLLQTPVRRKQQEPRKPSHRTLPREPLLSGLRSCLILTIRTGRNGITIWEDGVPKTYVKTWDPVTQQWTYILDTDTPLDRMMLPKTGGRTRSGMMALLCLASLGGICISLRRRKTDDN